MEFTIKNKQVPIKFNLSLMYKMNKKLATVNQETGQKNNDGVGSFFSKVVNEDIEAIADLIQMQGKYTENDVLEAIDNYLDGEDELKPIFDDIREEMISSGFFKEQISKYIKNIKKAQKYLVNREGEEAEIQKQAIQDQLIQLEEGLNL